MMTFLLNFRRLFSRIMFVRSRRSENDLLKSDEPALPLGLKFKT